MGLPSRNLFTRRERFRFTLIVKIDAKRFVAWLFQVPPKRLMKPLRAADIVAVGRRLTGLAMTQPDSALLLPVAQEVWKLMFLAPQGRIASNQECDRFLHDFLPYMPVLNENMDAIRAALKKTKDADARWPNRNPKQADYLIERLSRYVPSAAYLPRTSKRMPGDETSEKVAVAVDAMVGARCKRPYDAVADALRESKVVEEPYCSVRHIKSRIRALGPRVPLLKQEVPMWLHSYWHSHPELANQAVDEPEWPEFRFNKCSC